MEKQETIQELIERVMDDYSSNKKATVNNLQDSSNDEVKHIILSDILPDLLKRAYNLGQFDAIDGNLTEEATEFIQEEYIELPKV